MSSPSVLSQSSQGQGNLELSATRVCLSTTSSDPAYRVWDYEKQKVYDIAAIAFDEEADPGWWRGAADEPEEEELLSFPLFVPPPATPSAPVLEVVDASLEQPDNSADAESAPPSIQEAPEQAASIQEELPPAVPPPAAVEPKRSTREN